jgi:hypothetical protein
MTAPYPKADAEIFYGKLPLKASLLFNFHTGQRRCRQALLESAKERIASAWRLHGRDASDLCTISAFTKPDLKENLKGFQNIIKKISTMPGDQAIAEFPSSW